MQNGQTYRDLTRAAFLIANDVPLVPLERQDGSHRVQFLPQRTPELQQLLHDYANEMAEVNNVPLTADELMGGWMRGTATVNALGFVDSIKRLKRVIYTENETPASERGVGRRGCI